MKIFKYAGYFHRFFPDAPFPLAYIEVRETTSYRFEFEENPQHLPVYVQDPKRITPDALRITSGFGLSCFSDIESATMFVNANRRRKKFFQKIGDSIFRGTITPNDGAVTVPLLNGHFTLFEYSDCNPQKVFTHYQRFR